MLCPQLISTLFPYTTLFRSGARRLRERIHSVGTPQGFARLCVGAEPAFPLEGTGARARALASACAAGDAKASAEAALALVGLDRKSTRLNSSHSQISYAVFC